MTQRLPSRCWTLFTFTLLLGDQRRDRLASRIRVENRSGDAVTDPGCRVNTVLPTVLCLSLIPEGHSRGV